MTDADKVMNAEHFRRDPADISSSFLACNSYDCVAPYVDIILHNERFWAKSAASGSVRWCCFRSCWTVLSHVMRGRPSCLLQSAGGEANRILLASALSSMRIICPNRAHIWIRINPAIQIGIPDHFWLKFWHWRRLALSQHSLVYLCYHEYLIHLWHTALYRSVVTDGLLDRRHFCHLTVSKSTTKRYFMGSTTAMVYCHIC